jgi:hypothetical protein
MHAVHPPSSSSDAALDTGTVSANRLPAAPHAANPRLPPLPNAAVAVGGGGAYCSPWLALARHALFCSCDVADTERRAADGARQQTLDARIPQIPA